MGISEIHGANYNANNYQLAHKQEKAGTLAFNNPETAGTLANNVGGSLSLMA